MRILVVSFSVNGAMGDNFFLLTRFFSKEHEVFVVTNKNIGYELLGTKKYMQHPF